jgi:DNA replicative helicase MCM subunit Mcm2 (Cdc46/Mcm family)
VVYWDLSQLDAALLLVQIQQLVTISKRTSIIISILYSRSRSILDNIRVSNAILSRFDLVFLLLDDPDLQRDKKLSEHVMKLHSRNRKRKLEVFAGDN